MRFLGIDPGINHTEPGGLVMLGSDGRLLEALRIPTHKRTGVESFDRSTMREWFDLAIEKHSPLRVLIERQQYRPGDSGRGAFTLGGGYLALLEMIECRDLPLEKIMPKRWQAVAFRDRKQPKGRTEVKELARIVALELCPELKRLAPAKADSGIIDAYHIARYGWLQNKR